MTRADLKASTRKELAEMAKRHRVVGWHSMRKDELVNALSRVMRRNKSKSARETNSRAKPNGGGDTGTKSARRKTSRPTSRASNPKPASPAPRNERRPQRLSACGSGGGKSGSTSRNDVLVAEVCDPHWIHVRWQLSQRILERAEAALGMEWHLAVPVVRVFDVTDGEDCAGTKSWVADVEIQTDSDNWYVPVADSPRSYKLQIGYRAPSGKFFTMARSRKITTPRPNGFSSRQTEPLADRVSANDGGQYSIGSTVAEIAEAVRAHQRSTDSRSSDSNRDCDESGDVAFQVEADVAIRGIAHPQSKLTLLGEPVDIAGDGSFAVRFALAEGRQVIPAVMLTPNGNEQRTIVIAVERNTKHLEPRSLDEML